MNRGKIPAHLIKKSTPIGRVGFMFLDEESIDYEFQKELGEYQCSLFIHSDHIGTLKDDIDELLETTAREVRSNQQIFKSYPYEILHGGSVQKYFDIVGFKAEPGDMLLKAKTKAHFRDRNSGLLKPNPIKVLDPQGNKMKSVPYTYKGSRAKITYNLFPWSFGGKAGVRCSLHEVNFIELKEFVSEVNVEDASTPSQKVDTGEYGINK